ncbi:hypothetical protein GALMADRAFT_1345058 [Galerina marginata CBS 339.88]|uniref:Uncharacterized protein n=1 Tax=Galerina marginata (strain CBS 339.88) TaxID=685588 RepID=A0A067SXD1_GALM3|nr:hypothetical protein GALMADRAFT_1345058 [Galerina marginata CBS 339.88]
MMGIDLFNLNIADQPRIGTTAASADNVDEGLNSVEWAKGVALIGRVYSRHMEVLGWVGLGMILLLGINLSKRRGNGLKITTAWGPNFVGQNWSTPPAAVMRFKTSAYSSLNSLGPKS